MQEVRKLLCDEQWEKLSPLLPGKPSDPGATAQDNRLVLEAVLWIMRTGSPWRDLPAELGNWHTTYTRFKLWGESGVWQRVCEIVSGDRDLKMLMIDNTVVPAHQQPTPAKKRGATGNRPFAWWMDEQDSRRCRCARQPSALAAHWWRGSPYYTSQVA